MTSPDGLSKRDAVRFVVFLGVVSLFADMTYEGGRSIAGPFLGVLGAGATVVGVVAGAGELVGYGLRYLSGTVSDRTHRYWAITILGYALNLVAVPLLALAGRWEVAAVLLMLERTGKAIRNPARDAMLSEASHAIGHGWGFGLHEAMDQTGALLGPLIVAGILAARGTYHLAFAWLAVPAVLSLTTLLLARRAYPRPAGLEISTRWQTMERPPWAFWLYSAAGALIAIGYVDYPIIAFHVARVGSVAGAAIPLLYALAMATSAVTALGVGRWFDRWGVGASVVGIVVGASFAPLVFWGRGWVAVVGMAMWGVGLGVQESSLRAGLTRLAPVGRRASAYGRFDMIFGIAWFVGSVVIGVLYVHSIVAIVAISVVAQLAAVPCLVVASRRG